MNSVIKRFVCISEKGTVCLRKVLEFPPNYLVSFAREFDLSNSLAKETREMGGNSGIFLKQTVTLLYTAGKISGMNGSP